MNASFTYVGSELDLFSTAVNWKSYLRGRIAPYLGEDVLEVGAGLGGTTRIFRRGTERRWVCLEPDALLAGRLEREVGSGSCEVRVGTLEDFDPSETFDTILYMDVLEHIEDDRGEVARAAGHLRAGGHLIAVSPAHQWLFTPFDAAIGHYRRYTKAGFGALASADLRTVELVYLDSVGLLASMANKLVLNSAMPSPAQIAFWDRVLVRMSRVVDPILGHSAGKSVLAVWRKSPG